MKDRIESIDGEYGTHLTQLNGDKGLLHVSPGREDTYLFFSSFKNSNYFTLPSNWVVA